MTKRDALLAILQDNFPLYIGEIYKDFSDHFYPVMDKIEALYRPSFSKSVRKQAKKEEEGQREPESRKRVREAMECGEWMTDEEIADKAKVSEHAVSTRRSELSRLDGKNIEKRLLPGWKRWQYRLVQ